MERDFCFDLCGVGGFCSVAEHELRSCGRRGGAAPCQLVFLRSNFERFPAHMLLIAMFARRSPEKITYGRVHLINKS
jgi:hypothetical protein